MDKVDEQHLREYKKELRHLEYRIEAITGLIADLEKKDDTVVGFQGGVGA